MEIEQQIQEAKEIIDVAKKELSNLHDAIKPESMSWADRQFNQIMRLLREATETMSIH